MPVPLRFAFMIFGVLLFAGTFLTRNSVYNAFKLRDDPNLGVSLQKDAFLFMARVTGIFFLLIGLLSWVATRGPRP
jgi:hypothetical protein